MGGSVVEGRQHSGESCRHITGGRAPTWPSVPHAALMNSAATSCRSLSEARSRYGVASRGFPAYTRHPIKRLISAKNSSWNGRKLPFANASAAVMPVYFSKVVPLWKHGRSSSWWTHAVQLPLLANGPMPGKSLVLCSDAQRGGACCHGGGSGAAKSGSGSKT